MSATFATENVMPLGFTIHRSITRPDRALVERFRGVPTADLGDVMRKHGAFDPQIKALFSPMPPVVGTAITVNVPDGAFDMIKVAINTAQAGDVVMVNARGNVNHALLGGNVCRGMRSRGIEALIVDGAIRDLTEIREDGFPVFTRGVALVMGTMEGAGEVNVPIACGGVVVNPGDIIVADEDGIVAVPPAQAEAVLEAAAALHAKHASVQPLLLSGGVTNIDSILENVATKGAEFIDAPFA
jgi:regulator of RNase E activity RraA